ncbi:astE [Symbiodinium sp. CCMP2592]|nr:astE [Symbiodinium sp. CCMP2592]
MVSCIANFRSVAGARRCFGAAARLSEIAPSVWRVGEGRPRVVVLGGVHGNELSGVEVVQRLVSEMCNKPEQVQGEITLAIGNPPAVSRGVRFVHQDLNRCFQEVGGDPAMPLGMEHEQSRAKVLMPLLRGLDVLLDLHATNKPSKPFARLPGLSCGRCQPPAVRSCGIQTH